MARAQHGQFFWKNHDVFLSKVLAGERIGLEPLDERYWCVYFGAFPIAYFDSVELATGNLPDGRSQDGDGNLEISKNRDSQIPTATTTATGDNPLSNTNNPTPDVKVLPICPV